ncbi:hypothetical protein [Natranaerobius trueperi]|uniref:Uncharacterized protein n=1 Tax=Natranaerobius trueperi TaxID=759412 RepID=A0A226BZP8_9FIRM|nr:hypothetical protein [Natranaerobius trueperi]OWZ83814.1 hypothetical protein CDO51_06890 [Natranaerobius trueperi]
MKRKDSVLLIVILYLILVGIFLSTGARLQDTVIFSVLSALIIVSSILLRQYYLKNNNSLKKRLISLSISYIKLTIFSVVIKELTGFSVDYSFLVLFFVALSIFTLWEFLELKLWEKGVLVLVLITVLGIRSYENADSSSAYRLYHSELGDISSSEQIEELLDHDYRKNFSEKDYQKLQPYFTPDQNKRLVRYSRPALLEFEDGQILLLEVSQEDPDSFKTIELLPEKVGSYFRYYPLEIERKGDYPKNIKEEKKEAIIETRGAFISHHSHYQKNEWYEKLIRIFGENKVWDKLEMLRAPEGPIQGAGINKEGYLYFRFCTDWDIDKEILDEIYVQFRDYAVKNDIQEVPVVFKWVE